MKQKKAIVYSFLALTLVFAAFAVGKASASTGCFSDSNGHWAETFICWLKDNGISSGYADGTYHPDSYITRGEMAVMLQKLDNLAVAQDNAALSTGDIYVSSGNTNWQPNAAYSGYIEYFSAVNHLRSTAIGAQTFIIQPELPFSLYNHQMSLKGVKVCYQVNLNTSITNVTLTHYSGAALPGAADQVVDNTTRADTTCREYDLASPAALKGTDFVSLNLTATFTNTAAWVNIVSTTFILTPSASAGVLGAPPASGDQPSMEIPSPDSGLNP